MRLQQLRAGNQVGDSPQRVLQDILDARAEIERKLDASYLRFGIFVASVADLDAVAVVLVRMEFDILVNFSGYIFCALGPVSALIARFVVRASGLKAECRSIEEYRQEAMGLPPSQPAPVRREEL